MGLHKYIKKIIKPLTEQRGEVALIGLIKFFLLFAVIGIGVEIYRFQSYHSTLQTRLEIIAQDALELSIRDEFRQERVSKIIEEQAHEYLYDILMTELNLDLSLNPRPPSILQRPLVITTLEIEEGSYAHNGTRYYNVEYPSIYIKGYTHQRLVLIPLLSEDLKLIEVPFNIFIENRRYD